MVYFSKDLVEGHDHGQGFLPLATNLTIAFPPPGKNLNRMPIFHLAARYKRRNSGTKTTARARLRRSYRGKGVWAGRTFLQTGKGLRSNRTAWGIRRFGLAIATGPIAGS